MRVLITNHHLSCFGGSEIATLDLAKLFTSFGCEVNVATLCYGPPIYESFRLENINVTDLLEDELPYQHYDLIWAHHAPVLNKVLLEKNITADKILVSLLSPYEPLEAPPLYVNDLNLCLVNSRETGDNISDYCSNVTVFNNSVSEEFLAVSKIVNAKLSRIAVVSNHLPREVLGCIDILRDNGFYVDIYGFGYKEELITPDLITSYDAVVSIGRTVQYCLVLGVPIYCYDRFGGPGWINSYNINMSEYYNFSGRCTVKKLTSEEIVNGIVSNYDDMLSEIDELKSIARARYSLKNNVETILGMLNEMPNIDYNIIAKWKILTRHNDYYLRELKKNNELYNSFAESQIAVTKLSNELIAYKNEVGKLHELISELQISISEQERRATFCEINHNELQMRYNNVMNSYSWKITAPIRKILSLIRHRRID
jgi:hypothetical protein